MSDLRFLQAELGEALRQTLSRYAVRSKGRGPSSARLTGRIVALTGSMRADPSRVMRRIDSFLEPYVGHEATWLVGSSGVVDEAALQYLLDHGEDVTAVGYHRYDLSHWVRSEVEAGRLPFLDASLEPAPSAMVGPSARAILFCLKADLLVLLWDRESEGTRRLIHYFLEAGKNVLVGIV
jgi:hypothetical protein